MTTGTQTDTDTMLDMTVEALRAAPAPLDELRRLFEAACDAFEQGDDAAGFRVVQDIVQGLIQFAGFCATLLDAGGEMFDEETCQQLADVCMRLKALLSSLVSECETGNFTEFADLLRFDGCELLADYQELFGRMLQQVES